MGISGREKGNYSMVLTRYISKSCILPDLQATTKAEALKELTHLLFEKKKMRDMGATLDQIVAREITESTGIGNGIAIPHARVPGMKTLACAIGRTRKGLDFMAVDREPVHLIFLICYPPTQQTTYLNFIATVARLLGDPVHCRATLEAETANDIYEIIKEASTSFTETHDELASAKEVKTARGMDKAVDAHAGLILLARLQLCQEMLATAKTGKGQVRQRIERIRSLMEPRIVSHYDRLAKNHWPALVAVEGDTCQGCFMRLPSKFVQQVRQDPHHIHTCMNCRRFIYVV